jgi:hypothetical protein
VSVVFTLSASFLSFTLLLKVISIQAAPKLDRKQHRCLSQHLPQPTLFGNRTHTEQLRYKLYRKIKECLPRAVSSFFQKGQLAITAADPVAARNGAAVAAVYPAWRHIVVGADGLHMDSCINLDCVTSFTDEVLGAQQQQQQQQRFQPQHYMGRNNAPPPRSAVSSAIPTSSSPATIPNPPPKAALSAAAATAAAAAAQPHHTQQNPKQQQQQIKTHRPRRPPQQQVQAYSQPSPPVHISLTAHKPTSPRYNEATMTGVVAPVRVRDPTPSGETLDAKHRSATNNVKEGVNGAKH